MADPTLPRIVERVVIEKYDGDPPTPDSPKTPVEVVVIDRRDGVTSVTTTGKDRHAYHETR